MICIECGNDTRVLQTRYVSGGAVVRRRRLCGGCGCRFTTKERCVEDDMGKSKKPSLKQIEQIFDDCPFQPGDRVIVTRCGWTGTVAYLTQSPVDEEVRVVISVDDRVTVSLIEKPSDLKMREEEHEDQDEGAA